MGTHKQNYYQKNFLESFCFFIKTAIEREKEKIKLKNLSYVNSFTYAQNRNHFNEYIEQNRNKEPHSLGVIYLDLNGLKEINDKIGHIAGDTLIITASYALQEIFLDNSYRVGGDEFVVIGQDVSELLFFDQYAKLLKRMKELEISVATGCVWKETCSNLSETLQEAIKRCMKIKSDIILQLKMIEEDKKDWKLNSNLLCVFEMKLCHLVKLFFSKFLYEFLAAHIHLASGTFLKFKIIFFFHKIPRFQKGISCQDTRTSYCQVFVFGLGLKSDTSNDFRKAL